MARPKITDENNDGHFGYGELLKPSTVDALISQHNEHADAIDSLEAIVPAGEGTIGPGANNTIAKFVGANAVDDSSITDDGSTVSIPVTAKIGRLNLEPHVTTAALINGTTEDWDPGIEGVTAVRVQTHASGSTLGGIKAPTSNTDGRILILLNHGDGNASRGNASLTILHRSSGSAAVNRICTPDLTDIEIPYTGAAILWYEGTGTVDGSWFILATSEGGRVRRTTVGDLWLKGNYPTALAAGNNNDWEPTGWSTHTLHEVLVNTGAVLTGLKYFGSGTQNNPTMNTNYTAGIVRVIANRSSLAIKVAAESSASSVENRIASPNGDFEIPGGSCCVFVYDFNGGRWRVVNGIGVASKLTLSTQADDTLSAGNNNNWNPTNFSTIGTRRITGAGATPVITGMVAQEAGAVRTLLAYVAFSIKHQDANSSVGNKFFLPPAYQASGLSLGIGDAVTFRYDTGLACWQLIALAK